MKLVPVSITLFAALSAQISGASACSLSVSAGDAVVGISIITDSSCNTGGLGCINDDCRFCATAQTPQSSHLMSCSTLMKTLPNTQTSALSPTPTSMLGSACLISADDRAAGIQIVSDASCSKGGLGCSSSHCRQCRYFETPQSMHLLSCTSLGYAFSSPSTTAPLPSLPACIISEGDLAVGIKVLTDLTCQTGGLGCHNDWCRFCRATVTPKSAHLLDCSKFTPMSFAATFSNGKTKGTPDSGGECTQQVSPGDAAAGILITTDSRCANGGIGCIDAICRFCRVFQSPQSASFLNCSDFGVATSKFPSSTTASTTSPPSSNPPATPAPTPAPIPSLSSSPIPTPSPAAGSRAVGTTSTVSVCSQQVSPGDAAAGVLITTDTSCANGGIGCIDAICRFCKVFESPQSTSFLSCSTVDVSTTSTTPTPSPSSSASPPATPVPAPAIPLVCDGSVTSGDEAVGIRIVTDPTCSDGGVGCVNVICRLCKIFQSTQSSVYSNCSDIPSPPDLSTIDFVPITLVNDIGDAEILAPLASTVTISCAMTVSSGDAAVGLQIVTDPDCITVGGLGCIPPSACKYCKTRNTTQSMTYEYCDGYPFDDLETQVARDPTQAATRDMSEDSFWVGIALSAAVVTVGIAGIAVGRMRMTLSKADLSTAGGPTTIKSANFADEKAGDCEGMQESSDR